MRNFLILGIVTVLLSGGAYAQNFVPVIPGEGTLSQAIADAQDGDVLLLVPDAEYTETAASKLGTLVNKSLTITVDGEGRAIVRMLRDLEPDTAGVFFRLGDQASLTLNGLELDGNAKFKYLVSYYMPVTGVPTLVKKIQIENCLVHDLSNNILHGMDSKFASYLVVDTTIINNTITQRTGTIVHYKYCGANYIAMTNSTFATVTSYGIRISGAGSAGTLLPANTPTVVIDHTNWYNIGATDSREILLGDAPPLLNPWTVTNSIFVKQVATGNSRTFINIKDNSNTGDSNKGTITNICFWNIDKIAFYSHTVHDTIRMDPQFADADNYDFTLPAGSPLLTFGTDGKPIGDPRWGTNYVNTHPDHGEQPFAFALHPNYPNPFNPRTTLVFSLPQAGWTTLKVYDVQGRERSALVNAFLPGGLHRLAFDGSHLPSGVYFCQLKALNQTQIRKILLMK